MTTENIINFTENFGLDDGEKFTQAIKNRLGVVQKCRDSKILHIYTKLRNIPI